MKVSLKSIAVSVFKASSTTLIWPKLKRAFFPKILPLPASPLKIVLFM